LAEQRKKEIVAENEHAVKERAEIECNDIEEFIELAS